MPGQGILFNDRVVRHCRATDLSYGANGEPNGVNESAFRPKSGDLDGLSVVLLDFFAGTDAHRLNCVRSVITLKVTLKQRMAVIRAGLIRTVVGGPGVIADPCDDLPPATNAAHALIVPLDALNDITVRQAIASSVRITDVVSYRLTP